MRATTRFEPFAVSLKSSLVVKPLVTKAALDAVSVEGYFQTSGVRAYFQLSEVWKHRRIKDGLCEHGAICDCGFVGGGNCCCNWLGRPRNQGCCLVTGVVRRFDLLLCLLCALISCALREIFP